MIATQAELDRLVERLAQQPELAVDCEMDSMYAYRTSLCVVQLGWEGGEALIDALAGLDVSGLGRLFADPAVIKVFHGGENDIGMMAGSWKLSVANIFDTMAASQVLGKDPMSLAALVERHFDVKMSKQWQKADWRVRPLPDEQAEYARLDVRYLIPLRRMLQEKLEQLGRVEEAQSEFARILLARLEDKAFDPERWIKVKGARELPPDRRAGLRALYVARDAIACALDRAPYRVMHDSVLIDLALRQPQSQAELLRSKGLNRGLSSAHLDALLAALHSARGAAVLPLPRMPRSSLPAGQPLTPEQETLFDALRAWRTLRADARGVQVARVATNVLLAEIARRAPASEEQLAAVPGMEPWRLREYGAELLDVLRASPTT
jgi:ribonuclease D